jgi:site-specific DNA recombinase
MINSISPSQTPLRFAIYSRISSDKTGAGLGVERQETECRELVDKLGGAVVRVFADNDISAYSGKPRPEYESLLAALRAQEFDAVAVWHQDRLLRRNTDLEGYIDVCGPLSIPTHTVKAGLIDLATPAGRAMARNMATWATYEVETSTMRVKSNKLQMAKLGAHNGGKRPFGYTKDGLTIVPEERDALLWMADRLIAGDSFRTIALALNARRITTTQGQGWKASKVKHVLLRKRNVGVREHLGSEYPAQWPAIFDQETYASILLACAHRSSLRTSHGTGRKHLLTGFLECGKCGNWLTVYSCQQRDGSLVPAVACRTRDELPDCPKGCGGVKRNLNPITDLVTDAVLYRLDGDGLAQLMQSGSSSSRSLVHAMAERQAQQSRLDEIVELYSTGELNFSEYSAMKSSATKKLEEICERTEKLTPSSHVLAKIPLGQKLRDTWDAADLEWKRQVIDLLIDRVVVHPKLGQSGYKLPRYKQWRFDPNLIEIKWRV